LIRSIANTLSSIFVEIPTLNAVFNIK
jgi:hypothetical protein